MMMKGISFLVFFLILSFNNILYAEELMSINFQQRSGVTELELIFDSNNVKASKFHVKEDKQIILDLKNTSATDRVMRAFDTSEFSGSVVFVSAYKKPSNKKDLRIAIQLRDNVRSLLTRRPNRVVLKVENRFGVFTENQLREEGRFDKSLAKSTEDTQETSELLVPKSEQVEDILENLTLSGRKKYIGKNISINVKNLPVSEILKMIADASGFNIIQTKEVESLPTLSINLNNTPWDRALDTILGLNKLVAKKNGKILLITTLAKATEDQKLEAEAKRVAQKEEALVTKIFPISYAKTTDIQKIAQSYLTPQRGSISTDERTNYLIVKDTEEVIERIKKIIEALDAQTAQVLIEARIVEVKEGYAKEIGLKNKGVSATYDAFSPGASLEDAGPGFSLNSAPSALNNLFQVTIGNFGRLADLDFQLQLMEREEKAKVVSTPKVITQNKKKATLGSTDGRSFVVAGATTETPPTISELTASLKFDVTPQVTNEGSISLDIDLSKEDFGAQTDATVPPAKTGRNIKTNVLVENGSTIVIGGLYKYSKQESHSGVPFLKNIPLIGWLFRTAHNPQVAKDEMIIFVTPRIVNQEEAGIANNKGS